MKPTPILAVACALALGLPPLANAAERKPGDASTVCAAPPAEVARALIRATNRARASARRCGATTMPAVPRLRWNGALARAARKHSRDMAGNDFFSHTGSDGLKSWDRAVAEGYDYRNIGENIAAGYPNAGSVQEGWLDSPGHCRNIMNPSFTQIGVGCTRDTGASYGNYWTVVFGRPR